MDQQENLNEDKVGYKTPPNTPVTKITGEYYEMYYDQSYKAAYFYNPSNGQSVWQLPEGAICADMTKGQIETINKETVNEEFKEAVEDSKQNQKWIEIEELKRKNMEAMYPEFYNNEAAVNQESDEEEDADDQFQQQIKEFGRYQRIEQSELLKRPARRQIQDIRKDTAYIEGNYDYNIWYDKYLTDKRQDEERVASMYKCNPSEDTGFTKADKFEGNTVFCTYFARGCCSEGVN